MAYNFFAIRTHEEPDGTMYPVFSGPDDPFIFELEESDGPASDVFAFSAKAREMNREVKGRVPTPLGDLPFEVFVTSSRIVFCCQKYDQGQQHWGVGLGATVALGANLANKAKAAYRRRGKMLAGHIRYTWLMGVGGGNRSGWTTNERLRFLVVDGTDPAFPKVRLDIVLAKALDAVELAQTITHRAARYQLTNPPSDRTKRDLLESLLNAPRRESTKSMLGMHTFPSFRFVRAESAHLPSSSE